MKLELRLEIIGLMYDTEKNECYVYVRLNGDTYYFENKKC